MRLVLFVHVLGSALWIGGAAAAMTLAVASRSEPVATRAAAFRLLARVHTTVIGLGAALVVGTGLLLTMGLMSGGGDPGAVMARPRIWVMQGAGLVGGLLVLFVGLPAAVKAGGLAVPTESGGLPPTFERYRKRQAVVSSVAGVLALVALYAATVLS